jgi:hypothetical protein
MVLTFALPARCIEPASADGGGIMGNFFTDVIQADPRFDSTNPISDMALLEPHFREMVTQIISDAAGSGADLRVLETYRSQTRQTELFDKGATQLKRVGVHHYGLACDFGVLRGGQIDWHADYRIIGRLAEARGLTWGGRFSFHDNGHVQGVAVADQPKLFDGSWYPSADDASAAEPELRPAVDVPLPGGLTDAQELALEAIDRVNARFANWFNRSSLMAFVQVESSFRPRAFRKEPSGVASYGLMQVLDVTAAGLGLKGDPEQMFDPDVSVFYGALYASKGWNSLLKRFGRIPTYAEWADGYNHGYGAANLGSGAYAKTWITARDHWAKIVDLPGAGSPS